MELQDSGHREQYPSGGQRERAEGKGRYDLIPPEAINALALVLEAGAKKYGDRNWEKGLPLSTFLDSGLRHFFKLLAGEEDEDHAALAMTNLAMFITTRQREEDRLSEEQERAEAHAPLITEGPFTGWRQLGYTTEGEAFKPLDEVHSAEDIRAGLRQAWQEGDKANVDELTMRTEQNVGWVGDNRCGLTLHKGSPIEGTVGARPHAGHMYRNNSQWCDGYVAPDHRTQVQADVEAIKRIADAQLSKPRRVEPNWEARSGG